VTGGAASPADGAGPGPGERIGFLGPEGTFTEQALLTQADLAGCTLVPLATIPDVLAAVDAGEVDQGFVGIENSIEGTVTVTVDALALEHHLLIQREVVIGIQLNLLVPGGTALDQVERVLAFPHATAQCRGWLAAHLPGAEVVAANSNAEAAQIVGDERDGRSAAIAPALAAKIYDLDIVATDIEDHPENQTRFVLVSRDHGIPAPTGHDKTTVVVFQRADRPGSLLAILQEFAARAINLTKLESRPTKKALGDYCFVIDLEGHVADEVVADCMRDLKSKVADVKFLGSYPAAGDAGPTRRRDAEAAWQAADAWIGGLRSRITR
jgi:prephenate dehydratase